MNKENIESIIKSFEISGWNLISLGLVPRSSASHQKLNSIDTSSALLRGSSCKEREFLENLYVGRFNYFLVVFSLFVMAGFANNFKSFKSIVFYAGVVLLFMVWLLLYRAYKKHDRMLRMIFYDLKDHPAHKFENLMRLEGYKPKYKASKFMGVYIPWFCIIFLLLSGIFIDTGILK